MLCAGVRDYQVHGNNGDPADWQEMTKAIRAALTPTASGSPVRSMCAGTAGVAGARVPVTLDCACDADGHTWVMASASNAADTLVGVQAGGANLAAEVIRYVEELPRCCPHGSRVGSAVADGSSPGAANASRAATRVVFRYRFSIVCHSLGGLFSR